MCIRKSSNTSGIAETGYQLTRNTHVDVLYSTAIFYQAMMPDGPPKYRSPKAPSLDGSQDS